MLEPCVSWFVLISHNTGDPDWRCRKHKCLRHDIFISYRVATDADLAIKLQLELSLQTLPSGASPTVFLDKVCLKDGLDWRDGFLYGLQHCTLAVLLISEPGLQRIQGANTADDNVLLEYEYALSAMREGKLKVMPLLVRNRESNSRFAGFNCSVYPEEKHSCSASTATASIRSTMMDVS